jgi:ribosomal protein L32
LNKEYTLKQPDKNRFKLDFNKRNRVKVSPCCNRSNSDGKFVPLENETHYGYCYSCGKYTLPGDVCPHCRERSFLLYADKYTGEIVGDGCGYCTACKYNIPPSKYFSEGNHHRNNNAIGHPQEQPSVTIAPETNTPPSFIADNVFKGSLRKYEENHFVTWLSSLFDPDTVSRVVSRYSIGTTRHFEGGTVYWQIDTNGNVRGGKILQYDPGTGKRNREIYPTWVHKVLNIQGYNLKQCLFGEHLLKVRPGDPVALCEAEKTAVVCSEYFPQLVWVATGGKTGLTTEKLKVLRGRTVLMFPDADGFEEWKKKAEQLKQYLPCSTLNVSDILQTVCTGEGASADLCDYVIQFPVATFHTQP